MDILNQELVKPDSEFPNVNIPSHTESFVIPLKNFPLKLFI